MIETNVPFEASKGGRKPRYPWKTLAVKGSFVVRCHSLEVKRVMNGLTSCRAYAQKVTGFRFSMRTIPAGIRVWRVK